MSEPDLQLTDLNLIEKIKAMIISAPKVGKTTLAGTFPKPAFLDTDYGIRALKNPYFTSRYPDQIKKIRFFQVEDVVDKKGVPTTGKGIWKAQEKLNEWEENPEVETIIFDTMTTFSTLAINAGLFANKDQNRSHTIDHFKKHGVLLRTQSDFGAEMGIISQVMDWVIKVDKNVLVLCHERPQLSDSGGVMWIDPLLTGQLRSRSARWFDEVWYLKTEGRGADTKRVLITQPDGLVKCVGSRLGLPAKIVDPDYGKIYNLVQEAQKTAAPKAVTPKS